jgi:hypothetical protein
MNADNDNDQGPLLLQPRDPFSLSLIPSVFIGVHLWQRPRVHRWLISVFIGG